MMADRIWNADHKAIRKIERQMNLLKQGGGLVILVLGLLIPATLFTSVSSSALQTPDQVLHAQMEIASDVQDGITERSKELPEVKMMKIQMILERLKTGLPLKSKLRLAQLIYQESLQYNYDPELVLALIITESSFYNWSKSKVGALGLMQILPTTGRDMARAKNVPWRGKRTLFDPHTNIKLGIHYLAELHDRFGNLEVALTAYNYGPSRVAEMQRRGDQLPRTYAARIMNIYKKFLELDQSLAESWNPGELDEWVESDTWNSVGI
jgi:soluble lytic murein transglycosylase